jgi:hypothetical protein
LLDDADRREIEVEVPTAQRLQLPEPQARKAREKYQ